MSNSYFQFKEFRINQERSAMKVSTDACVLGAFTPVKENGSILDIGTGSGLLTLMMAQRSPCEIDAVELDEESFLQAKENIGNSRWNSRIHLFHADIRSFSAHKKYDLIVCNPPFFEKHLKSPSLKKNKAKHAEHLSMEELVKVVKKNLKTQGGKFSVLLPEKEFARFTALASEQNLLLQQQLFIRDNPSRPVIRVIGIFSFSENKNPGKKLLTIKDAEGNYTNDFIELMSPFYLNL